MANARKITVFLAVLFAGMSSRAEDAPAIFTKDARILFQGDSITDGNRGRSLDPNHILGHGYQFIIAAKFGAAYPALNLTFLNRGVSGNTAPDLQKRWKTDALDLKPDVLSILVGINDAGHGVPLDKYEAAYEQIIEDSVAANPKLRLVLCESYTLPVGKRKDNFEAWNTQVKGYQAIVAKLALKHHAALVKFQKVFDDACEKAPADYWIWDGVHPTYRGHQLMADEWVRTVQAFWPAK